MYALFTLSVIKLSHWPEKVDEFAVLKEALLHVVRINCQDQYVYGHCCKCLPPGVSMCCVIAVSDPSHRSMPNLAGRLQRAPPQSHTNETQAGHNTRLQPRRSPATGSGLKAPSGASRALSPRRISRMASPGRTLSPMRGSNLVVPSQSSMLPAPKTYGMPRNNSASKLPSPKRLVSSSWFFV